MAPGNNVQFSLKRSFPVLLQCCLVVGLFLVGLFFDDFFIHGKIIHTSTTSDTTIHTERKAAQWDEELLDTTNNNDSSNGESKSKQQQQQQQQQQALQDDDVCWQRFLAHLDAEERQAAQDLMAKVDDDDDHGISLVLHRNGDVDGCGVSTDILSHLRSTLISLGTECPKAFEKYQVESIITRTLHQAMPSCASLEPEREEEEGFLGYCDLGESRTPVLMDHELLIPIEVMVVSDDDGRRQENNVTYLPCHFHTREGIRLTSFQSLLSILLSKEYQKEPSSENCKQDDNHQTCLVSPEKDVHLYAVPAGRVFMFAPAYVGEIFDLPHIQGADPNQPVTVKVLSLQPRVFDIFNFFTREESAGLVEKALNEQSETHRIKRSSTGASGYTVNSRRTSENGFDTHGKTAQAVKRRCFDVLGFDEYIEGHSDGLQILRYNQTTAYTAHMDWIDDDDKTEHNYDSAGKGGNRYATILMYMTDLEEGGGGETVFVHGKPLDGNAPDYSTALAELRSSEQGALFQRGTWQETMVAQCRSSLAVRPSSARAVLFYSQLPNGQVDPASLHGGCPVLSEQPKWAANLWVWNTPRAGFPGAPVHQDRVAANQKKGLSPSLAANNPPQKLAKFSNEGGDPAFDNAELFYMEEQYWGKLGHGDGPHFVNTYEGQIWNVKVNGEIRKTWVIGAEKEQTFTL